MKVGTFGYSHSRGLGHLTLDFYKNGIITDVLVVEHPSIPVQPWYPDAPRTQAGRLNYDLLRDFCKGKDAMLFFETPFYWPVFDYCREIGVRTYLCTMYECTPIVRPFHPHKYLCPSLLDVDYFQFHPHELVQLPVDSRVRWRLREKAEHFVHNGGYLGMRGKDGVMREGTETVIRAMQYVKSPIQLTIRVQENVSQELQGICGTDARITYVPENVEYGDLYGVGDVAVGAQKWNGCSLPLQEAYASGLLVINTDRYPMNTWLPPEPLVRADRKIENSSIGGPYMKFTECCIDPIVLAAKMDEWYGRDCANYSLAGKAWAYTNSWELLRPVWKELLSK